MPRILFASDLHIGRSSSRVGERVGLSQFRASHAWNRIVDIALKQKVTLVCLGGDVADQDNKFFEAIGPLKSGLYRLGEAGIMTVAVSGNHDFDVLPRLADELPSEYFRLLGKGGKWERYTHKIDNIDQIHIDGWSFPEKFFRYDPLESYKGLETSSDNLPVLGLLHGDLGNPKSSYAPISKAALDSSSMTAWHLGHIHTPKLIEDEINPWVLYPGSPQALDPGESGCHGVWISDLADGKLLPPKIYPISTIFYDSLEIDVGGINEERMVDSHLIKEIEKRSKSIVGLSGQHLKQINFRVTISGKTSFTDLIKEKVHEIGDLDEEFEGVALSIESVKNKTRPALKIEDFRESKSVIGTLARIVCQIEEGKLEPETDELIQNLSQAIPILGQKLSVGQIYQKGTSEEEITEIVKENALALIAELIEQET